MKIGLDIHGVINSDPKKFISLALSLKDKGYVVYIITGATISEDLVNELLGYNDGEKFWDNLVSIQDTLLERGYSYTFDKFNRPVFDDLLWDSFKGKYCDEHNINIMIDDTESYRKYFNPKKTYFLHYKK